MLPTKTSWKTRPNHFSTNGRNKAGKPAFKDKIMIIFSRYKELKWKTFPTPVPTYTIWTDEELAIYGLV